MRLISTLMIGAPLLVQVASPIQERADRFLSLVNAGYQALYTISSEAQWKAATG